MKEIVQDGAEILRETAKPVPEKLFGSAELEHLISDMALALDKEPEGVALAAPQVGVSWRLFIVRKDRTIPPPANHPDGVPFPTYPPEVNIYINPEIVKTSRKRSLGDEGCLSVRGVYGTTNRHERVTLKARNLDGSRFERGAGGLMAQIFEHEMDHLNGILFTDHAERLIRATSGSTPRFAYFGTPSVASDTLAKLMANNFIPSVVVTSPDAPRDRGLVLAPSETKKLAVSHGVPVLTPFALDDEALAAIRAYDCEYAIVVAYGKIFPKTLIDAFPNGVINVHYSLLPKYRGSTPLESALLAGDSVTGVTIQKMSLEIDAGAILAQKEALIAPTDTARELRPRLIELGAQLLVDTLPSFLSGDIMPIVQDDSQATHSYKIKKEDGLLDLDAPAKENWNKYRAYADSIGTYFFEKGKRFKITSASLKKGQFIVERVIPDGKKEQAYKR